MYRAFVMAGVGFAVLTAVLSVATVAGMVIFTSLSIAGLSK